MTRRARRYSWAAADRSRWFWRRGIESGYGTGGRHRGRRSRTRRAPAITRPASHRDQQDARRGRSVATRRQPPNRSRTGPSDERRDDEQSDRRHRRHRREDRDRQQEAEHRELEADDERVGRAVAGRREPAASSDLAGKPADTEGDREPPHDGADDPPRRTTGPVVEECPTESDSARPMSGGSLAGVAYAARGSCGVAGLGAGRSARLPSIRPGRSARRWAVPLSCRRSSPTTRRWCASGPTHGRSRPAPNRQRRSPAAGADVGVGRFRIRASPSRIGSRGRRPGARRLPIERDWSAERVPGIPVRVSGDRHTPSGSASSRCHSSCRTSWRRPNPARTASASTPSYDVEPNVALFRPRRGPRIPPSRPIQQTSVRRQWTQAQARVTGVAARQRPMCPANRCRNSVPPRSRLCRPAAVRSWSSGRRPGRRGLASTARVRVPDWPVLADPFVPVAHPPPAKPPGGVPGRDRRPRAP